MAAAPRPTATAHLFPDAPGSLDPLFWLCALPQTPRGWKRCRRLSLLGRRSHREGLSYGRHRDGITCMGNRYLGTRHSLASAMGSYDEPSLRQFNCKLVVMKEPWWKSLLSTLSFILSYAVFSNNTGSSYRYVDPALVAESEKATKTGGSHHALVNVHEDDRVAGYEEDLAPGGDHVKLLLLPKPFSPAFRENWDVYRTEYWEKENERRAVLRAKIKERDRQLAKQQGGWLWWTGWRGWNRGKSHATDIERTHHHHHHRHLRSDKDSRRGSSVSLRSGSHSRASSRSSTPTLEPDEGTGAVMGRVRRGSSASNASERRRRNTGSGSARSPKLAPLASKSAAPDRPSPLVRESSATSLSSMDSDRPSTPGEGDSDGAIRASTKTAGSPGRRSSSGRVPQKEI